MQPDEIEASRLADALHKLRIIEVNMQVLTHALKDRAYLDARIVLREAERLVQVLNTLLDELDSP